MKKKILALVTAVLLIAVLFGCGQKPAPLDANIPKYQQYAKMTPAEIVSHLTLPQKAAQMIQPAGYMIGGSTHMNQNDYGSVLHNWNENSVDRWRDFLLGLQRQAIDSESGIPYIYGTDSVHGCIRNYNNVIFPHNIGVGAANDPELTYQMGLATADEMKMLGMLWNFSPCVASAQDPRWGRTYESYSSDLDIVKSLGAAYAKGNIDGGVLPCAKHFLGDGEVMYGTGENGNNGSLLIDRGDAQVDDIRLDELLSVYKALIDSGVKSVMITHGSVNGVKAHANKYLITDRLKGEMGLDGFVVSDWESIHNIPDMNLKEQVITAINAGIDMLMEPHAYQNCLRFIVEGVNEGAIPKERIDDAVTRIIKVKMEMGLFGDPMMENLELKESAPGSEKYREIARQLVEKSLVLLKNEDEKGNKILPLKKGSKIYVTGPAANDTGVLCGGWTYEWSGGLDDGGEKFVPNGKTILDGFNMLAEEYGYTTITDPKDAKKADVIILCVGEKPYAEWEGDTADLSITGALGLDGNEEAICDAEKLSKPVVACIVAGRNVIYDEYENNWDAVVMCYLPGSEGHGVANVLSGKAPFSGKLPMPYYSSVDDIRTDRVRFDVGYGLHY